MLAAAIRRGLAAGLLAGLLAGLVALAAGQQTMAEAIRLEDEAHAAADPAAGDGHGHDDELFSRTVQQAMLPAATGLVGLGLGGLFGVAFAFVGPRLHDPRPWSAHLRLGAVAWLVTVLAPLLTTPPNPPGVGEAGTVGARSQLYVGTIALTIAVAFGLWWLARRLAETSLPAPARQVVVGVVAVLAAATLLAVLPSHLPGGDFPAELLWQFRLASVATQTTLWAGIAVGSGLLWQRASTGRPVEPSLP